MPEKADTVDGYKIGNYAFYNCTQLSKCSIPDSVTTMENYAFANCTSLGDMRLPSALTNLGTRAFEGANIENLRIASYDSNVAITLIDNGVYFTADDTEFKDSNNRYLNRDNTAYEMTVSEVSTAGLVTLSVKYDFKSANKKYITNEMLKISIPSGAQLADGTVKLDGKSVDYSEYNGYFTVNVGNTAGKLTFGLKPNDSGYLMSYAQMSYMLNSNQKTEIIGIVNMANSLLTLNVPSETKSRFVTVSGVTSPNETVSIFVDGKLKGTVQSSSVGNYSQDIILSNPSDGDMFKIEAVVSSGSEETKVYSYVTYAEDTAELTQFDMHYRGNTYDLIALSNKRPIVSWSGSSAFSFVISFDDNSLVDEVYVLSTKGNEEKRIKAVYDIDNNCYVASGFDGYVPGTLSVEYSEIGSSVLNNIDMSAYVAYENEDNVTGYITKSKLDDGTEFYYLEEQEINVSPKNMDKLSQILTYDDELCYVTNEPVYVYRGNGCFVCQEIYIKQADDTFIVTRAGYGVIEDGTTASVNSVSRNLNSIFGMADALKQVSDGKDLIEKTYTLSEVLNTRYNNDNSGIHYAVLSTYIDTALDSVEYGSKDWGTLTSCKQRLEIYKLQRNSTRTISELADIADKSISLDDLDAPGIDKKFQQSFDKMKNAANRESNSVLKGIIRDLSNVDADGMNVLERVLASNDLYKKQGGSKFKYSIDPSGYVYEAVDSNRLSDVQATIYYKETEDSEAVVWDAEEYDQQNPLFTDVDGSYAWDVPEGLWQVEFEKEGYKTAYTDWVSVPPPQLDLNVEMISADLPEIEFINAYNDEVDVTFNQYMNVDSVINGNIIIIQDGKTIEGIWEAIDAETGPNDTDIKFATAYRFLTKSTLVGEVEYNISGIENYSGVKMTNYSDRLAVDKRITNVELEDTVTVNYKENSKIIIKTSSAEAASGKQVKLWTTENDIISIPESVKFNTNGEAVIEIKSLLPGTAIINYKIDKTNYSGAINVNCIVSGTSISEESFVLGDVNNDGKINVTDVSKTAAHVKGIRPLDENAQKRADVNGDNKINVTDIAKIAAHVKGIKPLS